MFTDFIKQILETERIFISNRQEKTVPDVIGEKTVEENNIPDKFRNDIEALKKKYGVKFKSGLCINISLQEILMIIPRQRKRQDAYTGLISFLKSKMGIELNITSQKKKEEENENQKDSSKNRTPYQYRTN